MFQCLHTRTLALGLPARFATMLSLTADNSHGFQASMSNKRISWNIVLAYPVTENAAVSIDAT